MIDHGAPLLIREIYMSTMRILSVFALLSLAFNTFAEFTPYNKQALQSAKESGKTIVLDFHASWCPTCKKQKSALESILQKDEFKEVRGFIVDYDKEADLKKEFKIIKQSTLVVLKGHQEISRGMGVTSLDEIEKLIQVGLK
jgi:thioredoxin 1